MQEQEIRIAPLRYAIRISKHSISKWATPLPLEVQSYRERTRVRRRHQLRSFLCSGTWNVPVHHLLGVYGWVLGPFWLMLPPLAVGPLSTGA